MVKKVERHRSRHPDAQPRFSSGTMPAGNASREAEAIDDARVPV